MHNCVHDWTLAALNRNIDVSYYWYSLDCVRAALDWNDYDSWGHLIFSRTVHHALRLLHQRFLDVPDRPGDTNLDKTFIVASFLSEQAQLHAAEQMYPRALDGYEKLPRPDWTLALRVLDSLGWLYSKDQGRQDEAERMFIRLVSAGR
ncbi:unnamed protein product [Penicillium camemberti]|uniref:Str. FM013 n=1 Tax=Penicillium camemberti (strain FM 013) TaxID=1429867 RepID=A0A0G4PAP8_PENC3|nr:unnamed protein product [Penicillium camemberti]